MKKIKIKIRNVKINWFDLFFWNKSKNDLFIEPIE